MENLSEWFENAYVAYRLVGYPDSVDIRHAQGRAISSLARAAVSTAYPPTPEKILAQVKEILRLTGENWSLPHPEHSYSLSPDRRYFAGTVRQNDGTLISAITDLDQKRVIWRLDGLSLSNVAFSPTLNYIAFMVWSKNDLLTGPIVLETNSERAVHWQRGAVLLYGDPLLTWKGPNELAFTNLGRWHCLFDMVQSAGVCRLELEGGQEQTTWWRAEQTTPLRIQCSFRETQALLPKSEAEANENYAMGSLRTIVTAGVQYRITYPHRGFPHELEQMGPAEGAQPGPDRADLVDAALASGTNRGYSFSYQPSQVVNGVVVAFEAHARPLQPGRTGDRNFCVNESGVIRQSPAGTSCNSHWSPTLVEVTSQCPEF